MIVLLKHTIFFQIHFGDLNLPEKISSSSSGISSGGSGSMGATQKQPASEAMEKFFPPRYMDGSDGSDYDQSVLESYLIEKWASLRSKSVHDCVRIYLNCTRKWQFFGAQLFSVQVSTSTAILLSYCKTSYSLGHLLLFLLYDSTMARL